MTDNVSTSSTQPVTRTLASLTDRGDWTVRRSPIVEATAYPPVKFLEAHARTGLDGVILGYLSSSPQSAEPNKAYWGGLSRIVDAEDQDHSGDATTSDFSKKEIAAFQARGGQVVLSFGGADTLLESVEHDVARLAAVYSSVLKNYAVRHLDFSFEGGFLVDQDALVRHIQALTQVLQANPTLQVSYTLAADGAPGALEGFSPNGQRFLEALAKAGIEPSLVSGLLMEFGQSAPWKDAAQCCVIALQGMHRQLQKVFPHWSSEKIWRRMGACPMYGSNTNEAIVFSLEDMRKLVAFALEKNLGNLSGWSLNRDENQGQHPQCEPGQSQEIFMCTRVKQAPYDFARQVMTFKPTQF